jgi:4'-phosphopantetheinyl transferase EntD
LAALAPPGVRTGCRRITAADLAGLHPIEAEAVPRAVPSRRHEFATGRALLRALLDADVAIPVGADRAPVLPTGRVGSLAHTGGLAVAAAIGIDIEPVVPLDDDIARVVLRPDERGVDAHLAFTLKEALYKAWSRLGGAMLEHHDVRLTIDPGGRFAGEVVAAGSWFDGRWAVGADHWLALVAVAASHRTPPEGGLYPRWAQA